MRISSRNPFLSWLFVIATLSIYAPVWTLLMANDVNRIKHGTIENVESKVKYFVLLIVIAICGVELLSLIHI